MRTLRADERPVSHYRAVRPVAPERKPVDREPAGHEPAGGLALAWLRDRTHRPLRSPVREEPPVAARPAAQPKPRAPGFFARVFAAAIAKDPRDPSPTRLEYRIERLWLTPYFRRFVRAGLPALVITACIAGFVSSTDNRAMIAAQVDALRTRIENRPEFMVGLMSIDGASGPVADAIRSMLPVRLPASSFAIDLPAMRAAIEQIDAVESATLQIRAGGVLAVNVVERRPAVLWRTPTSLEMLDATGHRVATLLDRAARPDLPVIAGERAEQAVPEALAILKAAGPVLPRVRGLVRVGERRWNVVLDRSQVVLLPAENPVQAIEQALALNGAEGILERDVAAVDLRNMKRPTVRLTAAGYEAMTAMNETVTKVAGQ